jgi:hypothetical protein
MASDELTATKLKQNSTAKMLTLLFITSLNLVLFFFFMDMIRCLRKLNARCLKPL